MSKDPLVSVIMPTYKRAGMICRAIDSVLGQTYANVEVVVANDNDPDSLEAINTNKQLERYNDNKRVIVVQTSGSTGGGAARNYAAKHANGEYLAFLDDDDEYLPDKVEKELRYIQEHDLDMAFQDVCTYKPDGSLVEYRKLDHVKEFNKEGLLKAHVIVPLCPTSIYMLKKELFDRTRGFGETITAQDWHLMRRCIEAGGRIGYMPGSFVKQYLHEGARVSLGPKKIAGEKALYEWKKRYFYLLDENEIKFVKFRHYAVLAISCLRSKMYSKMIKYLFMSFASSPSYFFKELIKLEGSQASYNRVQ